MKPIKLYWYFNDDGVAAYQQHPEIVFKKMPDHDGDHALHIDEYAGWSGPFKTFAEAKKDRAAYYADTARMIRNAKVPKGD